jgi:hypothetical protein
MTISWSNKKLELRFLLAKHLFLKKARPAGGKTTLEPLSHPYTRVTQSYVSAESSPHTVTAAGRSLNLCFGVWRGEGIFLTQSENSFPQGIEPRTWEVLLGCLDHSSKAPFAKAFILTVASNASVADLCNYNRKQKRWTEWHSYESGAREEMHMEREG